MKHFDMYNYMKKMHVSDDYKADKFDNHRNNIIAACKKALCRLVSYPFYQKYAAILLTFNIREYLEQEERIALFELFNGKTMTAAEYTGTLKSLYKIKFHIDKMKTIYRSTKKQKQ
ncbi:hypothetical protein [Lysinibacillus sp. NPDC047702]|uniref:hypothetical protein n=1 Tax=unclassified Lysinibacillus TaxID=2636778 RepID=UPI003CFCA68B